MSKPIGSGWWMTGTARLDVLLPRYGLGGVSEGNRWQMVRAWRWLDPWPDTVTGRHGASQSWLGITAEKELKPKS